MAAVAGLLKAPVAFLLFCLACNLISIYAPYRFAAGTLQAKKPKAISIVAIFITFFLMPLIMLPLLIPTGLQFLCSSQGWLAGVPVNLLATCAILAGVGGLVGFLSGTSVWRSGGRMLGLAALAAGVTYAVGRIFGATVS